jgi:Ni/Co efflux regulator RcnB
MLMLHFVTGESMHKKYLLMLCAAVALSLGPNALADRDHDHDGDHGNGHGRGHEKHEVAKYERHEAKAERREAKAERHYYREHDRELHAWYSSHHDHLPPGLAKRDRLPPGLERQIVVRGTLPPGLRARMHPCPVEVETYLPPPPVGYIHTVIGGNIVLVNRKNFLVMDVFHFEL